MCKTKIKSKVLKLQRVQNERTNECKNMTDDMTHSMTLLSAHVRSGHDLGAGWGSSAATPL